MANELYANYNASATVYAVVRRKSDGYVWNGTAFAAWVDGSIATYDIPLASKGGDLYAADMPAAIAAGTYLVDRYVQAGATPATGDNRLSGYEIYWTGSSVAAAPSDDEPITLAEAKLHLREDGTEQDTLISSLIITAREWLETRTKRCIKSDSLFLELDEFPARKKADSTIDYTIYVPRPPLVSVTSITYVDTSGATQTMAASDYQVDADSTPGRIFRAYGTEWPDVRPDTPGAVRVNYEAGYTTVPEAVKTILKLMVGHLYANRELVTIGSMNELPLALQALCGTLDWGFYG